MKSTHTYLSPRHAAIVPALMLLAVTASAQQRGPVVPSPAESAASVWITSLYGRNNSGVGLAMRHSVFGLAATVFGFAGDTTTLLPVRPGGVGIIIDALLVIDLARWLAIYGNVGWVGRISTYPEQERFVKGYESPDPVSVGGGVQVTVVSHIVLGAGFNAILATKPSDNDDHRYRAITSVMGQVGWRF